ncbi:MAG: hypothetical protein QOE22_259 [Candidatus Parcubacteria bacterium]|nr:hypothetical protein [Candidatus Parcubacteria bacterium]
MKTDAHMSGRAGHAIVIIALVLAGIAALYLTVHPQRAEAQAGCAAAELQTALKSKVEALKEAKPGLPTFDAANLTATTKISSRSTIMCILDGLAWTAAKVALKSMTQSVVNWINSGFEGSPAFITDLNRNLGNLSDAVANDFLNGLNQVVISNTGFNIRAPFQDQIAAALRQEFYRTTSSYGFDVRNPYKECYGDGFSINGFLCEGQNAGNNPYGRYQLARDELFRQVDTAARTRITELGWAKGFLSWRGPCGQYGTNAYPGPNDNAAADALTKTAVQLSQAETTNNCSIRTPGAVIENALGISVTSPFRQLELADSVNEIVAALMTQMVNQVLGGAGLTGVSQPAAGGGTSYINQNAGEYTSFATEVANGFSADLETLQRAVSTYRSQWQRIDGAARNAQSACANDSSKASQAAAVLARSGAALAKASAAITAIATTQTQINAARGTTSSDPNAPDPVVNAYLALIKDTSRIPGEDEFSEAERESSDTGTSLYSQMTRLAASCR